MPGVADNVTLPAPHRNALVPVGVNGIAVIAAVRGTREAEVQPVVVFLATA